jgi:hypothetical protein
VPSVTPDPELLANYAARTGSRPGFVYSVKDGYAPSAMDVLAEPDDVTTDDTERSVRFPFAASTNRDRTGDLFEVNGMELDQHRRNPQAFLDHGRWCKWSMGLDQNPATKQYTVEIDENRGMAFATAYIPSIVPEHDQVYEFYKAGILQSGSVGFLTIQEDLLPPVRSEGIPRGKHLIRTKLVETSLVFLPMNQDCVRQMYDRQWAGKSLCEAFREQLEPVRPRKRAISAGWEPPLLTVEVRQKAMPPVLAKTKGIKVAAMPSPAMSTTDASMGGALVPPPVKKKAEVVEEGALTPTGTEDAVKPMSHNVQRMADVHFFLKLARDTIAADPQLLDHPELKRYLTEEVGPKIHEMVGGVKDKLAETHPDLEPLEDKGVDEAYDGAPTDAEDAAVTPGETPTAERHEEEADAKKKPMETKDETAKTRDQGDAPLNEEKPAKKPEAAKNPEERDDDNEDKKKKDKAAVFHAPIPKLKTKATPPVVGKGMNMTQKRCMKDIGDHLDACAADPACPPLHKTGHLHFKGMIDDMMEMGSKSEETTADEERGDVPDGEKAMKLFTSFSEVVGKKLDQQNKTLQTITKAV